LILEEKNHGLQTGTTEKAGYTHRRSGTTQRACSLFEKTEDVGDTGDAEGQRAARLIQLKRRDPDGDKVDEIKIIADLARSAPNCELAPRPKILTGLSREIKEPAKTTLSHPTCKILI
jgi:hypothetical protein